MSQEILNGVLMYLGCYRIAHGGKNVVRIAVLHSNLKQFLQVLLKFSRQFFRFI